MTEVAQRNRSIRIEFDETKADYPTLTAAYKALAKSRNLGYSTIRNILKQTPPESVPASATSVQPDIPLDAIPPGYFVKRISTQIDEAGNTEKQWLRSDLDSKKTTEIQDVIPPGHRLKGVSTYVDEQGKVRAQWVKTDTEQHRWYDTINAVLERIPSLIVPMPPIRRTTRRTNNLLALYPLADLHVGLYASLQDSQRNWQLSDAVSLIKTCMDDLITRTPSAARAIVANLGDFTHTDNLVNRTPNSGTPLDADGRYIEIAQAAMELAIYVINRVAEHHKTVSVVWQSGNHDEATALVLQTALAAIYRDTDHIHVHQSGKRTHCIQHGRVALGFTHGDTIKSKALPLLMANDYPDIWAATSYRIWHCGHIHHRSILDEQVGCIVESHQSPAPRDAWHEQQGYRSLHSMTSITYDLNGEYSRNTIQIRHGSVSKPAA